MFEFGLQFGQVGGVKFQGLVVQNQVQLRHLLEVVHALEVLNQQTVQLVVGSQEIHQQQLSLELRTHFSTLLFLLGKLASHLFPEAFDFVETGPESEDGVVL